jgi:hypothetical protein
MSKADLRSIPIRSRFRLVEAPRPRTERLAIDPIYAIIEAHQNAYRDYSDGVDAENACEEAAGGQWNMDAEQQRMFARLKQVTGAAWTRMKALSSAMVTTKPTTLAGIGAVCRYMKSLLKEGTPGLPFEVELGDLEAGMGIFCDTIAAAIEGGAA